MTQTLADGKYCDRVDKETEYTVEGGKISAKLTGKSAVVLYNDNYVELGTIPVVKVADDTLMNFEDDSIEVTLNAENVKSAEYTLGNGAAKTYKDGDKITIGKDLESGDTVNLTLEGTSEDGNTTVMTYVFTKKSGTKKGTVVYFTKPDSWKDTVYAYVYDETSSSQVKNNAEWPGVEMKSEGDGKYSYTFDEDWSAPLIIFTDGEKQSNGEMEPGAEVIPDNVYEVK